MTEAARLLVLDVGHGNATLLEAKGGTALVDAGPSTYLVEFLENAGIRTLDMVLISHADQDHMQGLIHLLAQPDFDVRAVYANGDSSKGPLWGDLVWMLDEKDRKGTTIFEPQLREGKSLQLSDRLRLQVLAPRAALVATGVGARTQNGSVITSNSMSAVVMAHWDDRPAVLIPGDIDSVALANLLVTMGEGSLKADVLIFPHHGGHSRDGATEAQNEEFTRTLMNAVDPARVIFSLGRGRHDTPQEVVVSTITAETDAHVSCTQLSARCGAIPEVPAGQKRLNAHFAAGRETGFSCAGTIEVGFDTGVTFSPDQEHQAFVEKSVPGRLCKRTTATDRTAGQLELEL